MDLHRFLNTANYVAGNLFIGNNMFERLVKGDVGKRYMAGPLKID